MRAPLVLAFLLLVAPAAGAKLLRHASQVDPGTMDPHAIATLYNNRVLSQVYETLVGRDENFRIEGRLALSWTPLDGGKGWRFKLRPGVKFHDGTPFTAEDVLFTLKRVPGVPNSPSSFATFTKPIVEAKATDPYTPIF